MVAIDRQLITDSWRTANWNEYIQNIEHPASNKAKGYYYNGKYRIEITLIGKRIPKTILLSPMLFLSMQP